jgi:hypothetical protein
MTNKAGHEYCDYDRPFAGCLYFAVVLMFARDDKIRRMEGDLFSLQPHWHGSMNLMFRF